MTNREKLRRKKADFGTERGYFVDEVLETVWELREKGGVSLALVVEDIGGDEPGVLQMQEEGLIKLIDGNVSFTEKGEKRARDITRRHRLAERLFADVLALKEFEEDACRLEHVLSPEVEAAMCTFLGHPPFCPHGKPIPRGECCKLYARKIEPLVVSLRDLKVGALAKVVFIRTQAMDRLSSIGLVPGIAVKLVQRRPTYVLGIDETTIAIDEDIATGIYVKQV